MANMKGKYSGVPNKILDQNALAIFMPYGCHNRLQWSKGSVLAFSTQVRGFKPGRSHLIFRAKKSSARLPSEGK